MRILGIDPGTHVAGYGAVDLNESNGTMVVATIGVFKMPRRDSLTQRLLSLRDQLDALLERLRPDEVAVEEPFVARNVRSAFAIGEARGVALLSAAARHIPVHQYPPATVKSTVAGHGGATKAELARMLRLHIALPETDLPTDATDALAVALCHVFQRRSVRDG